MFKLTALIFLVSAFAPQSNAQMPGNPNSSNHAKESFAQRMLKSPQPFKPIEAQQIPGMLEASKRLGNYSCAAAVGGKVYGEVAQARLTTSTYFSFNKTFISAEEDPNGNVTVVFAFSVPESRWVFILPALLSPKEVFTKRASGGASRMDLVQGFENSHGLKPGSITPEKLQAIYILHEHLHLNSTGIQDLKCLMLSVLNTRWVIEGCFPELVAQPVPGLKGIARELFLKINNKPAYGRGSKSCQLCHLGT